MIHYSQHANILPPCDADELNHRADRIRTYVDTEIWLHKTSHTRRREEDSDTKQKWEALHEIDYLRLITENHPTSKLEWTLTHHLHAAAQYLDAISRSGESTQWLNCLLCKYHMSASSRCAECNADVQAKNKKVYQFGLTVEDYVTQLDMVCFSNTLRLLTKTGRRRFVGPKLTFDHRNSSTFSIGCQHQPIFETRTIYCEILKVNCTHLASQDENKSLQ